MSSQKESFAKWYEKNKEKLAEKRHKRYRSDKEYREKRKMWSKKYHWLNKRRATPIKESDFDLPQLQPDEIADVIISAEDDLRCGMTLKIPMYYPSKLSTVVGRSVQTLRVWTVNGYIPESTYRNFANYRIYTKDQLLVYGRHTHLLKLRVKNFEEHPYFAKVKEELAELEPDGIVKMTEERFQMSDEKCPWCSNPNGLLYLRDDSEWGKTPCLECKDPYDIEVRKTSYKRNVYGECDHCGNIVDEDRDVYGNKFLLQCPQCGRRIKEPVLSPIKSA